MKRIIRNISMLLAVVAAISSCSNELEQADVKLQVPLQITTQIETTRAAGVNDREFFFGDTIGIYVDGLNDAWNVKADYSNKWNLHRSITLDGTERKIIAYYPYGVFGTKEHETFFQMSAGVNHLVSDNEYVWNSHPVANLKFKHVMARVQLVVKNPAKTPLSNVVFQGKNIYQDAYYDLVDSPNRISYSNNQPVTINNPVQEEAETQTLDALLIPAAAGEAEITLNFADGKTYTTKVTLPELKQGGYYRLPITLGNDEPSEPNNNGHEYVDLGLTSGLLWATCNVGASSPSDYGNYYAWGETTTKSTYTSSNYTYSGNPTTLPMDRDAARVNWGGEWRMPTMGDFSELIQECTWVWVSQGGKYGYKVTSKKNGNSIFLPAAGYYGSQLYDKGEWGYFWSSSIETTCTLSAHFLDFYSISIYIAHSDNARIYGRSVRPVLDK